MSTVDDLKVGLVRQVFPPSRRPDVKATLAAEFKAAGFADKIKPGERVVITSGSRGIEAMNEVIRELVALVKACGAKPLLLPAMGSHGGGTAKGQVEVLEHLGQTEETMGAPIHPEYNPVEVGQVFDQVPVFVDKAATKGEADHVILVGRVKEHSEFTGPIESGLLKMAVVGLGRVAGATSMHLSAVRYTYAETIMVMARVIFKNAPVLGGIALVDDQHNTLCHLEALPVDKIFEREPELLIMSQKVKPALPWDALDILLLDEMGKDISGSGLDTKVIGRIMNIYEKALTTPAITRIITRRISKKGGGNAIGLGLSDFITRKLYDAVDQEMTHLNSVVAVSPEKGRCPIVAPHTKGALELALRTVGPWRPETLTLAWGRNTKDLEYLAVSQALWEKAADHPGLEQVRAPQPLPFDGEGELPLLTEFTA